MKRTSVMVVIVALALIVTACAPATTAPTAAPAVAPTAAPTEAPKAAAKAQVIRYALDGEPTSLDPTVPSEDLVQYASSQPMFNQLIEYSYDGKMSLVPCLAEKWEWVDPQTFKFTLRKGVQFHNGKALTTADVKYTFERIMDPATGSGIRTYLDAVESFEVVDDFTAIIHLKYSFAPFETYVLEKIYIVPDGIGDQLKTKPIGTGPFMFKEWVQGEKVVVVKNPNYWRKGKPKLDAMEIQFFSQYQTALNSFRAKNTDIIQWLNNADVDALKKEPGVVLDEMNLYGHFYIGINMSQQPFDNPKVRQALRLGVDKQLILDRSQYGYGTTSDINENPGDPMYTDAFNYKRDVEKAKQLLKEAGVPEGFEADLIIPLTPTEGPIGEAAAFSLSEIGLKINPIKLKVPEYIDQVFVRKDFALMICGYGGVPDPDFFDYQMFHSKGPSNVFHFANPAADAALDKGRTTLDPAERKKLYNEFFDIAYAQDVVVVWLIGEYRFLSRWDHVKDFSWNKSKMYNFEDAYVE